MSAEATPGVGAVVAQNVKRWRTARALDQQGLADRLGDLGWSLDRTAIVRIEAGKRKVSVDEVVLLALALNVPASLLMLPVFTDDPVVLGGGLEPVRGWEMWEWMTGGGGPPRAVGTQRPAHFPEPDVGGAFGEWYSGTQALWLYEDVRAALNDLERVTSSDWNQTPIDPTSISLLEDLVNAVRELRDAGYRGGELIPEYLREVIERLGVKPRTKTPTRRRPLRPGEE